MDQQPEHATNPDASRNHELASGSETAFQPIATKRPGKMLLYAVIPLAVVIVAVLAFVGYTYYQSIHAKNHTTGSTQQAKATDPYAGWRTFTDSATVVPSGVSIKYPSDWQVSTSNTKTYGWSITSASATITVNDLFLDSSKTARQTWEFCAGTD